jgi:putative zinc finger protein
MPCGDDFRTLLSRYVDGELGGEDRAKVEDHLTGCEPCRELLSLFQKNENLLAGALSTDAFGDAVIESVVRKISFKGPVEAKPVEPGLVEWLRARPWLQVAAAALLILGLVITLNVSHSNELAALKSALRQDNTRLDSLTEKNRKADIELQQQVRHSVMLQEQLGQVERKQTVGNAFLRSPEGTIYGYIENEHYLVARASFAGKSFVGFHLYRRLEKEKDDTAWKKLNTELLQSPEFVDRSAKPGETYVYRFHAVKPTGETVESVPLMMTLPYVGDFPPDKSIWIHCMDLSAPKDLAVFVLERLVNGKIVSKKFYTELGKPVGSKEIVEGVEVDFSTDLVLSRIETGTQATVTSLTRPVLDKDGNPVMEQLVGNVFVPAVKSDEVSIGQRESKKAVLRLAGTTGSKTEESLWKGSRMLVRARGE